MYHQKESKTTSQGNRRGDCVFRLNIVNTQTGASVYQVELTNKLRARVFGAIMKILTEDKGSMDLK